MINVSVFCFHRINQISDEFFPPIRPEVFYRLIQYITENYNVIHPDKLHTLDSQSKNAMITFDDGYYDFYEHAFPVLLEFNAPSLLAVVTDVLEKDKQIWTQLLIDQVRIVNIKQCNAHIMLGNTRIKLPCDDKSKVDFFRKSLQWFLSYGLDDFQPFLNELENYSDCRVTKPQMMAWKEVSDVAKSNVVIASHSCSHPPFNTLSYDSQLNEMHKSKCILEDRLTRTVNHFVYPNGCYGDRSHEIARQAGFEYAYILDDKIAKFDHDSCAVSRIPLYHESYMLNKLQLTGLIRVIKSPLRAFKSYFV